MLPQITIAISLSIVQVQTRQVLQLDNFANVAEECKNPGSDFPVVEFEVTGGAIANKDRYPYLVSLQTADSDGKYIHRCGGSLITPTFILTAAHCIYINSLDLRESPLFRGNIAPDRDFVAALNPFCRHQPGKQRVKIVQYNMHPDYTGNIFGGSDIAILQLETAFDNYQGPYLDYLGSQSLDLQNLNSGSVFLVGWGATESTDLNKQEFKENVVPLQEALLYYMDYPTCEQQVQSIQAYSQVDINSEVDVCFYSPLGADSCAGDSGGPIIFSESSSDPFEDTVIGITSWGPNQQCGNVTGAPGIYTKVSAFTQWITQTIRNPSRIFVLFDTPSQSPSPSTEDSPSPITEDSPSPITEDFPSPSPSPVADNNSVSPINSFPDVTGAMRIAAEGVDTPEPEQASESPIQDIPDFCLLDADKGPCEGNKLSYYYNVKTQKCETFFWGGCQGNQNNFATIQECQEKCTSS